MIPYLLLIGSLTFQAMAAVLALRLIPTSGVRLPWILISAALSVRFFREGISLWLALTQGYRLSVFEEGAALAVSALLLSGTALIRPLFLQLTEALFAREDLLEKAEQAHRRSEEERSRLKTVIDHLPVGVFILDADGRIVEVNEAVSRVWGGAAPLAQSVDEYSAYKGWWVATGEPVKPMEWAAARAVKEGEISLGEAIDIERFDGTRGTILNSAVPIRSLDGAILGAVVVNQDVTELRQLQQELEKEDSQARRNAAELQAIFHAIPDGLIIYNKAGHIVYSNKTAEQLTGFDAESHHLPIQERWSRVRVAHPGGSRLRFQDIPAVRALQGDEVKGMVLVFSPQGRRVVVSVNCAPFKINGEILGVATTFSDITPLYELQEQQGIFVQAMSHDLRTPLTVIEGHAELLKEISSETAGHHIEAILAGCRTMLRMMEDILDMARLEHKQFSLETQAIDPGAFIADFLRQNEFSLETARVRCSLPDNLPLVQADATALERILANLLTNGLKFSTGPIRFSACRIDQEVRFSVADRGRGIEAEDLPRIFDRFFRARGVTETKGWGMGLYITRLLAEAQGGRIWVQSRPHKGTVFFFTLPILASSPPETITHLQ